MKESYVRELAQEGKVTKKHQKEVNTSSIHPVLRVLLGTDSTKWTYCADAFDAVLPWQCIAIHDYINTLSEHISQTFTNYLLLRCLLYTADSSYVCHKK